MSVYTEEAAKMRWCPFVRVLLPVHQSGNRISTFHMENARKEAKRTGDDRDFKHYQQQESDCRCVASHCMAWRESGFQKGYCGLAGKP